MKSNISDDSSLIKQIAGAQTGALEQLYDRYNRLVFSVTLTIVGDPSTAEEITLDVFVHAWRGAKTYRPELAKVSTWLLSIARHRAIDYLRWQSSRPDMLGDHLDERILMSQAEMPEAEARVEAESVREDVRRALAALPEDQRQPLLLAYYKGYSHQQIAEALQQPLGTIKTRIRMAMQKLRKQLVDHDQSLDKSEDVPRTY